MTKTVFISEPSEEAWRFVRAFLPPNLQSIRSNESIRENWARLPFQDSQDHLEDVLAHKGTGEARIVFSSSGSGGRPKYTLLRFAEMQENAAAHGRGYRACGVRPEDIVATWGMPGLMNSEFTVYMALAQCGCTILPIGDGSDTLRLLDVIREFKPTVLLVMPSDFVSLATLLEREGLRLDHVRLMLTGGEPLLTSDRARFAHLLGESADFRAVFQTSDTGTIGYQCTHCDPGVFHLHQDVQVAEILDADEQGSGELVVTNLQRTLKPVLRRRTGDLVTVLRADCACGSKSPRLRLNRRIGREIKLGGEKFDTSILLRLRDEAGAASDDFRVEVFKDANGRDGLRILSNALIANPALRDMLLASLLDSSAKFKQLTACGVIAEPLFAPLQGEVVMTSTGKILPFVDLRSAMIAT
jgi:phenylacetate-coenzyme A ligase PaaK-like adenylate-forming protein